MEVSQEDGGQSMSKRFRDTIDLVGNNISDIREWISKRRPDIAQDFERLLLRKDIVLLMSVAYAAGRSSVVAEVEKKTITEVC